MQKRAEKKRRERRRRARELGTTHDGSTGRRHPDYRCRKAVYEHYLSDNVREGVWVHTARRASFATLRLLLSVRLPSGGGGGGGGGGSSRAGSGGGGCGGGGGDSLLGAAPCASRGIAQSLAKRVGELIRVGVFPRSEDACREELPCLSSQVLWLGLVRARVRARVRGR